MSILDATMRTIRHLKVNLKSVLAKSRILFLFVKFRRLLLTAFTVYILLPSGFYAYRLYKYIIYCTVYDIYSILTL